MRAAHQAIESETAYDGALEVAHQPVRQEECRRLLIGQLFEGGGPGKHTLTTDNIPILSRLKGWKYGFHSPFKADVYYLTTRLFTGNKWGTSNPVMVRDQDFGIVRVRAFGTYDFRIVDPPKS